MKYNRLFFSSISIGILLSVWAILEKSTASGQTADMNPPAPSPSATATPAKGQMHDGPVTNFVKHNQGNILTGSKASGKKSHRNLPPWFFAQLLSDDGSTYYIRYLITDEYGLPTDWHSRYAAYNESNDKTLFNTNFDHNKDIQVYSGDDEVIVIGTDTGGKLHVWKSDSTQNTGASQDDGDVSWTLLY